MRRRKTSSKDLSSGSTLSWIQNLGLIIGLNLALCASFTYAQQIENIPKRIDVPQLEFSKLGDTIVGGSFDSLTKLTYQDQGSMLNEPSSSVDNLVLGFGNDIFTQQPFADGIIKHHCEASNGVFVTGNFTKIFNISVPSGMALVNFDQFTVLDVTKNNSLIDNLQGSQIQALWCNQTEVFVGGHFDFNSSSGAAVYNTDTKKWRSPEFGGFAKNSYINAIVPHKENIVFGGKFSGLAPLESAKSNNSGGNSSFIIQQGMQPVSFSLANASGYPSQGASPQNASSVLCPYESSSGWESGIDSYSGYIDVTLAYLSQPTLIRLFNMPNGSGTKSFRIISHPAGSFMNLTYVDNQGNNQSCSALCPLPEYSSNVRYTDFEFVNVVPTSNFTIELLDFYGDRAGIKGVELFEEGQFTFARNEFNSPRSCGEVEADSNRSASAELTGKNWTIVNDFMSTVITDKLDLNSTSAQLKPSFNYYEVDSGNYEVLLYTPGCESYGTCNQRGQVNVTIYPGFGSTHSVLLYQTNYELKYDVVYNGTIKRGAYIRITPTFENTVPLNFVAYKASFRYLGPGTPGASALFEYSPSKLLTQNDTANKSVINSLGQQLGSDANVTSLVFNGTDSLLIGGESFPLQIAGSPNLLSLSVVQPKLMVNRVDSEQPLYGPVTNLVNANGTLFAVTSNETYQFVQNQTFKSTNLGPTSGITTFSLNNTVYWALSRSLVNQTNDSVALFNPEAGVIRGSEPSDEKLFGHLTGQYKLRNITLYSGSLKIVSSVITGGIAVLNNNPGSNSSILPYSFEASSITTDSSTLSKRETTSEVNDNVVNAGIYLDSSHSLILGHFNATIKDNNTVSNAILVSSSNSASSAQPLEGSSDLLAQSTFFTCVAKLNDTLVIGGNFSGKVNNMEAQSILIYNVSTPSSPRLASKQAPAVSSDSQVDVKAMAFKPNSTELIVAGSLGGVCSTICSYDVSQNAWQATKGLEFAAGSVVNDIVFETDSKLLIAGNFSSSDGTKGQVALFDFNDQKLEILPQLSGPVSNIVILSNSLQNKTYAAAGSSTSSSHFINYFDGKNWQNLEGSPIQGNSEITDLSIVPLQGANNSDSSTSFFSKSQALLVSGNIKLSSSSKGSVLIYDGTKWTPSYVATGSDKSPKTQLSTVFAQYGGALKGGVVYKEASTQTQPSSGNNPNQSGNNPKEGGNGSKMGAKMPAGYVVGIACAIGIGCVLLLTLLYLFCEWLFANGGDSSGVYQNLAQSKSEPDTISSSKHVK